MLVGSAPHAHLCLWVVRSFFICACINPTYQIDTSYTTENKATNPSNNVGTKINSLNHTYETIRSRITFIGWHRSSTWSNVTQQPRELNEVLSYSSGLQRTTHLPRVGLSRFFGDKSGRSWLLTCFLLSAKAECMLSSLECETEFSFCSYSPRKDDIWRVYCHHTQKWRLSRRPRVSSLSSDQRSKLKFGRKWKLNILEHSYTISFAKRATESIYWNTAGLPVWP